MAGGNSVMDRTVDALPTLGDLISQHRVASRIEPTSYDGTTLDIEEDARVAVMNAFGLTETEARYLGGML